MNFRKYYGVKMASFYSNLVLGRCLVLGWGSGHYLKPNLDMFLPKTSFIESSFINILSY